jgi:hypothetical protein
MGRGQGDLSVTVSSSATGLTLLVVLCAAALTQGCSTLHTQAGVVFGHNYSAESERKLGDTQAIAELGYVTGESKTDQPKWGYGATSYLMLSDPMRPGVKAIVRRRLNPDVDLDLSAGPMITYDSSGLYNGFIGGVALNVRFLTFRSEYMSWPVEPWDEYNYNSVPQSVVHHSSGHEQIWYNGLSMNGVASWVTAAVAVGIILVAGMSGAFE